MKLYEATIKYYVLAEDEEDARSLPPHFDTVDCVTELEEATTVDAEWWDSLPFCTDPRLEDDEKTCGQILTEQRKPQ